MKKFTHGVLTVNDGGTYTWRVFGKNEAIDDERAAQDGPDPGSHELMIAMLGDRGWELVHVEYQGSFEFWFKREIST